MIRKVKYILIMILGIVSLGASAQNSQVMYYMNLAQSHMLNPALRPSNTVYIGLPVISGINLNVNNNFVNFSDVFQNVSTDTGTTLISVFHPDFDIAGFMTKIKNINAIEPEAMIQTFGLGFNAGKDLYIFLDINERVSANAALPGDLFRLAFEGNEQFVGDKIDLSSFRGDIKYYREAGLGFSKNFSQKLRIGFKAKVLFGMAAASIDNKSLGIKVNDDYSHTFDADMSVNLSAPVTVYMNASNEFDSIDFDDSRFDTGSGIVDYLLKSPNIGFGADIGAEFRFTDRFRISAAVTDLGYIKWKRDITNLRVDSQFVFTGIDMLKVYNGEMSFDSLGQEFLDSLKSTFTVSDTKNAFTTYLPFGITFGGSYNLTKSLSLGILSYTRFIGKQVKEALTLSANVNFGNHFSTSLAYTAANRQYDNIGFGLAFRAGWFQIYTLADRIPVTWNKIVESGKSFPFPAAWNTVHFRIGMNLAFGNKPEKKNDKPMLIVP